MKVKYLLPLAGLLVTGCVTHSYTTTTPPAPPPGPTVAEIQSEIQAKVGDSVIVSQIQNSGTRYVLTVDQIIALKAAGASDTVLNAMISSANKPPVQAATTTVERTDYVYPPVYIDPWPWWGWGPYYYGGYYRGGYYRGGWHH
jgi:hypothetical protein